MPRSEVAACIVRSDTFTQAHPTNTHPGHSWSRGYDTYLQ